MRIELRDYQKEVVNAVVQSATKGQKKILFNMPTGMGKNSIIHNIALDLIEKRVIKKALIVYNTSAEALQYKAVFSDTANDILRVTIYDVINKSYVFEEIGCILFSEAYSASNDIFQCVDKDAILIGCTSLAQVKSGIFSEVAPVYIYTLQEAAIDGVSRFSGDARLRAYEFEGVCRRLFEALSFEVIAPKVEPLGDNIPYDFILKDGAHTLIVEVKLFRGKNVSLERIKTIIERIKLASKRVGGEPLLITSSVFPFDVKKMVYDQTSVTIWDLPTLLYYSNGNSQLISDIGKYTYSALDEILPEESCGWKPQKNVANTPETVIQRGVELIRRIESCSGGQKNYKEYEVVCRDVVEYLFGDEFSLMSTQHQTQDKIFRMDLLCSIKGNGEFWKWLVQHYNSRFVVFESKNYRKEIDQNLIYITEKYLFDTALRNVAVIISRKGFSKTAKIVADGCLKEHKKLIMDITDHDLIEMLNMKDAGEEPSDYMLNKLENYLMSISK